MSENSLKKSKLISPLDVLFNRKSYEDMMLEVKHDQAAFQQLYNKFKGPIMSYIMNMINNRNQAEELTQEVFFKVYRARESYTPQAKFTTWLWTIAKNTTFDALRKKKEFLYNDMENDSQNDLMINQIPDVDWSMDEKLIQKSQIEHIKICMEKLPLKQMEILQLRIFSELSYEEISKLTQNSIPSIKSIIHRAKKSLSECLKRRFNES